MITAVCFDLFETLITEYVANHPPSPSLAERLHIEPTEFVRAWKTLIPARYRGEVADFPATLRAIFQQTGSVVSDALIEELYRERAAQKARPFAKIDHTILAMLHELRQRGLKLGLISNASSEEIMAWQNSELSPFFEAPLFSCQVGYIKPEQEIYQLACTQLGVEPNETLFVGDGGSDELVGAQQAGLMPYWATWFIDQWPFARQATPQNEQFSRVKTPMALVTILDQIQKA